MELLMAMTVGLLFAVGIFQLLRRNLIRSVIGLITLANAVNLFLLSIGAYVGEVPAYISDQMLVKADALPQAMILTAIVISMGGTAFVLSMLYIISARYKTIDQDRVDGLKY